MVRNLLFQLHRCGTSGCQALTTFDICAKCQRVLPIERTFEAAIGFLQAHPDATVNDGKLYGELEEKMLHGQSNGYTPQGLLND